MSLRAKLLLSHAPLIAGLLAIGVAGWILLSRLGSSAQDILRDNYRSVLAIERMGEVLAELDRMALARAAGAEQERPVEELRGRFETELRLQETNVTESGEAEATRRLRALTDRYLDVHARVMQGGPVAETRRAYLDQLQPSTLALREAMSAVLTLNQDAMAHKSDAARRIAERSMTVLGLVSLASLLVALYASTALARVWLRPLSVLAQATRRVSEGDLEARARVEGSDEIARLADDFNAMAEHLQRYRASTLGELLRAQRASQAAIDSLPDPVLVLGIGGHLLHANRAAEIALRVDVESGLAGLEPRVRAVVERVCEHATSGKGAYVPHGLEEALRVATPDGDRSFLPRATPLYADEGDVVGATLVLQDVTRQIRFEELRNDLVATTAHELRTPLTSLRMAIHLLIEQRVGALNEKQADLVYAAREDCERLQDTVDELLDLSRIQAGKLELRLATVGVEALVRDALGAHASLAAERGVEIRIEVLPGLDAVRADAERILLVLANLLTNALRHGPPHGVVTLRACPTGQAVRFEVVDSGPGIPAEYQQAVFEKHFQLPGSQGSGLGLFISREIVHAHGGRMGVDSRPGKGSTFWFELPRP